MDAQQNSDGRVTPSPGKRLFIFLRALAVLGVIGLLDLRITSDLSVSSLYLIPVCMMAWSTGRAAGITMSFLATVVWFIAESNGSTPYASSAGSLWQSASRLIFYLVAVILVSRIKLLNSNLEASVRERTAELEAEVARRKEIEREAVEISEREQERVAHELHDQLAGYLAGIAFRVQTMAESLQRRGIPEAADAGGLVTLVNGATDQVRSLARLLAPMEGSDGNPEVALSRLSAEVETVFGITCPVDVPKEFPKLTNEQLRQLYRIAQEAVRNAIQHSHAELVQISLRVGQERLKLSVRCDGKAWELAKLSTTGLGLRIMRHRTERLGGTLSIQAGESGGTVVMCEVPLRVPAPLGQQSIQPNPEPRG